MGPLRSIVSSLLVLLLVVHGSALAEGDDTAAAKPEIKHLTIAVLGDSLGDGIWGGLYRKLVRSPAHVAAALRMMANWKLEPLLHDLPRLAATLVLVTGTNDRSISPGVAQQVREILPQAIIERVPALGHLAHEEQPRSIADLILRYARATAAAQAAQNM